MTALPRIRYIAFGGTISSTAATAGGTVTPALGSAELVAGIPQIGRVARVEASDFPKVGSYAITPTHWLALAREIAGAVADGCDGVVVTHGTDTIEETAYALAQLLPRGVPVVLTGAMRNPSMAGPDGPANLLAAFQVAASPLAHGLGPLVVLDDEIHAARFVTKTHTSKASTFVSAGAGPLGEVIEGRAEIWWRPAWEDQLGLPESLDGFRVELMRATAGPTDAQLRAAVASAPHGIVIEGTGGGHLPPALSDALDEGLAAGIPFVLASRCLSGATLEATYEIPCAEVDLIARGMIPVGRLLGHKARIRLLIGAALGRDARSLFPVR